jgi:hypothetical protein
MNMIPGVYQGTEGKKAGQDFRPDADAVKKMTKYNNEILYRIYVSRTIHE